MRNLDIIVGLCVRVERGWNVCL